MEHDTNPEILLRARFKQVSSSLFLHRVCISQSQCLASVGASMWHLGETHLLVHFDTTSVARKGQATSPPSQAHSSLGS